MSITTDPGDPQLTHGLEHWEGVYRVLGEQATWEHGDGARLAVEP